MQKKFKRQAGQVNRSMSKRAEGNECMDSYGYAGQIDDIRTQEFKRLEGNAYLDSDRAVGSRLETLSCVFYLTVTVFSTKS